MNAVRDGGIDDVSVDRRYIEDLCPAGSELAVPILHQVVATLQTAGEEVKDPGRDTPRAIFSSGLVCLVIYVLVPLTFLGCVYYPWEAMDGIRWLQILVLLNPMVYVSEGLRAALEFSDLAAILRYGFLECLGLTS